MNELKTFENAQFGQVRTVMQNGELWFVAADVCKSLEVQNPTDAIKKLDEDEKARLNLGLSGGDTNVVNEPGLYGLVLRSRKPEAKAFKRWITHEVIPSIRKSGGYIAGQESMTDAELLSKALLVAKRQIDARDKQIADMQPKALFADAVSASSSSILIGELAKLLRQNGRDIGQNRLFQWLREQGYLCTKGSAYNCPTQRSMELGLFEIKETAITHSDGHITINRTPKVTGKGQVYFVDRFLAGQERG